nr:hypothetical protein CFP56_21004 [Quercus suber]
MTCICTTTATEPGETKSDRLVIRSSIPIHSDFQLLDRVKYDRNVGLRLHMPVSSLSLQVLPRLNTISAACLGEPNELWGSLGPGQLAVQEPGFCLGVTIRGERAYKRHCRAIWARCFLRAAFFYEMTRGLATLSGHATLSRDSWQRRDGTDEISTVYLLQDASRELIVPELDQIPDNYRGSHAYCVDANVETFEQLALRYSFNRSSKPDPCAPSTGKLCIRVHSILHQSDVVLGDGLRCSFERCCVTCIETSIANSAYPGQYEKLVHEYANGITAHATASTSVDAQGAPRGCLRTGAARCLFSPMTRCVEYALVTRSQDSG